MECSRPFETNHNSIIALNKQQILLLIHSNIITNNTYYKTRVT